jgi:hypothetical protein
MTVVMKENLHSLNQSKTPKTTGQEYQHIRKKKTSISQTSFDQYKSTEEARVLVPLTTAQSLGSCLTQG